MRHEAAISSDFVCPDLIRRGPAQARLIGADFMVR